MDLLLYIHWNPDPTFFHPFGFPILYYSLLWIVGIACSYFIVRREYRDLRIGDDKFDPLFFYCFIGIVVGCRLGHCLFYQPEYYLSGVKPFFEMILPIKFLPDGGWKWTGYLGLASHGGTLGLIIALWLYCRRTKMHFMDVLDIIAVHGRAGHHRRGRAHLRLLHPPGQPDELRNHRQSHHGALGFHL